MIFTTSSFRCVALGYPKLEAVNLCSLSWQKSSSRVCAERNLCSLVLFLLSQEHEAPCTVTWIRCLRRVVWMLLAHTLQPSYIRKALSWKYFESISYFSYRPDHCNYVGESYFSSWKHTCIAAVVFSKPETNKAMAAHSWGSSNMPVSSPLIFIHPSSCIRLS